MVTVWLGCALARATAPGLDLQIRWQGTDTRPVEVLNAMRDRGIDDRHFEALGRHLVDGDTDVDWRGATRDDLFRAALAVGWYATARDGDTWTAVAAERIEVVHFESVLGSGDAVLVHAVLPTDRLGEAPSTGIVVVPPGLTERSVVAHELGHVLFAKRFAAIEADTWARVAIDPPGAGPQGGGQLVHVGQLSELFAIAAELQQPFGIDGEEDLRDVLGTNPRSGLARRVLPPAAATDRRTAGRALAAIGLSLATSVGADPGPSKDDLACPNDPTRCAPASLAWTTARHPAALDRAYLAAERACPAPGDDACDVLYHALLETTDALLVADAREDAFAQLTGAVRLRPDLAATAWATLADGMDPEQVVAHAAWLRAQRVTSPVVDVAEAKARAR